MTECIHTLFSAWGAPTAEARATATDAAIGPDFCYSDPRTSAPITDRDDYITTSKCLLKWHLVPRPRS